MFFFFFFYSWDTGYNEMMRQWREVVSYGRLKDDKCDGWKDDDYRYIILVIKKKSTSVVMRPGPFSLFKGAAERAAKVLCIVRLG